jgi:hypothetical protein
MGTVGSTASRLWFDYGSVTTSDYVTSSGGEFVVGTPVCAVVTMLSKSYDLYVNGNYKNTVAGGFNPTATAQFLVIAGNPRQGTAGKFDLCEFVIYSGSLSPSEISTLSTHFKDKWGIT